MRNPYRLIFEKLAEEGIRYLVVGGVAVNLHGNRRFTGDIDILLALDEENLGRMAALMGGMGYSKRQGIDMAGLVDEKCVKCLLAEGVAELQFRSRDYLGIGINVLLGPSLRFEEFHARAEQNEFDPSTSAAACSRVVGEFFSLRGMLRVTAGRRGRPAGAGACPRVRDGCRIPVVSAVDVLLFRRQTVDVEYLQRCGSMTPRECLDWLAAALEFVRMTERASAAPSQ